MSAIQSPIHEPLPVIENGIDRSTWYGAHGLSGYVRMLVIREIESRLASYLKEGLLSGSTHPSVGMEAVCVGVSMALRPGDAVTSTHRGHGHCLARGAAPASLLAELFGRAGGYCGGKGGSMHIAVHDLGLLGTNGIVGASIGIATGAALAAQLQSTTDVAVSFFGDGAINQGIFHEALNLASIWKLPVIFVCENNQYAQSAAIRDMVNVDKLETRASAYGIPGLGVDGMDIYDVWSSARDAVARARAGRGPTLLVAETWRYLGHMVGDTERYRTDDDQARWQQRDPLAALRSQLTHVGEEDLRAVESGVKAAIDAAESQARESALPESETAFRDVYGADNG